MASQLAKLNKSQRLSFYRVVNALGGEKCAVKKHKVTVFSSGVAYVRIFACEDRKFLFFVTPDGETYTYCCKQDHLRFSFKPQNIWLAERY